MVVMMVDRVSPGLRGELTRWLLEPKPGVFVGNISALVRDKLWEDSCKKMKEGAGAILIHSSANEQGFDVRLWGTPNRNVRDFEGLWLVTLSQNRLG